MLRIPKFTDEEIKSKYHVNQMNQMIDERILCHSFIHLYKMQRQKGLIKLKRKTSSKSIRTSS